MSDEPPAWLRFGLILLVFTFGFSGLIGMMNVLDGHTERAGVHTCQQEYGPNAEYVGQTSVFGGNGVCQVNGEQYQVDLNYSGVPMLPPVEVRL